MKNILGTQENLSLYNKDGNLIYEFCKNSSSYSYEKTYDENGNELTFKDSNGFWCEMTYDSNGNVLTLKDSRGAIIKRICKISHQRKVAPEFTMKQLVEKVGNFKLIK